MRKFRGLVRGAVRVNHVSRVRFFGSGNIPANATTYFPLLHCDDDPDYDLATDGTNIAEVKPLSRIMSIQLHARMEPSGTGVAARLEWMLLKDPDQSLSAVPMAPSSLFSADFTTNVAALRKYTLAYGWFVASTNRDSFDRMIRIRRKALRRAGIMHDLDRLSLAITNSAAAATAHLQLTGRIVTSC